MTCEDCKHGELHGYPPEGAPSWYCFSVYMMCSKNETHVNSYDTCDKYERGKPSIVRDDADW